MPVNHGIFLNTTELSIRLRLLLHRSRRRAWDMPHAFSTHTRVGFLKSQAHCLPRRTRLHSRHGMGDTYHSRHGNDICKCAPADTHMRPQSHLQQDFEGIGMVRPDLATIPTTSKNSVPGAEERQDGGRKSRSLCTQAKIDKVGEDVLRIVSATRRV